MQKQEVFTSQIHVNYVYDSSKGPLDELILLLNTCSLVKPLP